MAGTMVDYNTLTSPERDVVSAHLLNSNVYINVPVLTPLLVIAIKNPGVRKFMPQGVDKSGEVVRVLA